MWRLQFCTNNTSRDEICSTEKGTIVYSKSDLTIKESEDLDLTCSLKYRGHIAPKLIWLRNREEILDNQKYDIRSETIANEVVTARITRTSILLTSDNSFNYSCVVRFPSEQEANAVQSEHLNGRKLFAYLKSKYS